ncbi:MAG: 50S ribosomal protein L22, partial [Nitrosopumilus sp.]|nr:50S ribosomal protein L22 [Nitrosopumilus sp.]
MGRFDYAFQNYDATRHVRSSLREKDISHKHAREVAVSIKGLTIEKARDFLQDVINKKRAVAFR